ncbi:MAG: hypothetical protein P8177_13235, partial [Gemmatimonadota bacterium]
MILHPGHLLLQEGLGDGGVDHVLEPASAVERAVMATVAIGATGLVIDHHEPVRPPVHPVDGAPDANGAGAQREGSGRLALQPELQLQRLPCRTVVGHHADEGAHVGPQLRHLPTPHGLPRGWHVPGDPAGPTVQGLQRQVHERRVVRRHVRLPRHPERRLVHGMEEPAPVQGVQPQVRIRVGILGRTHPEDVPVEVPESARAQILEPAGREDQLRVAAGVEAIGTGLDQAVVRRDEVSGPGLPGGEARIEPRERGPNHRGPVPEEPVVLQRPEPHVRRVDGGRPGDRRRGITQV